MIRGRGIGIAVAVVSVLAVGLVPAVIGAGRSSSPTVPLSLEDDAAAVQVRADRVRGDHRGTAREKATNTRRTTRREAGPAASPTRTPTTSAGTTPAVAATAPAAVAATTAAAPTSEARTTATTLTPSSIPARTTPPPPPPAVPPAAPPAAAPAPNIPVGVLPPAGGLTGLSASGPITATTGQTIRGRRISNPSGTCIVVPIGVTDVTIEGNDIGPCGTTVEHLGVRVMSGATRVTLRGNVIHGVASGVQVWAARNPIVIEFNRIVDVRGPMPRGQAIQFDQVTGPGATRIVGNVSDAQAATGPVRYEDHISMYKTSGTAQTPILIACNKLRGGSSKSGSAIMVGDNGGGYFDIRGNIAVLTPNTGIGVAGGHDVTVRDNLIWNRGAGAASLTSLAGSMFTYAGNVPSTVSWTGNRGVANAWQYGGRGELSGGFWTDGSGSHITQSGNDWQDTSLTAAIWDTTPSGCR